MIGAVGLGIEIGVSVYGREETRWGRKLYLSLLLNSRFLVAREAWGSGRWYHMSHLSC